MSKIVQVYSENWESADVHFHDDVVGADVEGVAILAGLIDFDAHDDQGGEDRSQELTLMIGTELLQEGLHWASVSVSTAPNLFWDYDLRKPVRPTRLNQRTARNDTQIGDWLGRTQFNVFRSSEAKKRLIGANILGRYREV